MIVVPRSAKRDGASVVGLRTSILATSMLLIDELLHKQMMTYFCERSIFKQIKATASHHDKDH